MYHVTQRLAMAILPYIVLLVIPVLGRMSDFEDDVRRIVSATFATLLRLMPLEHGLPDPPGLAAALVQQKQRCDTWFC
jgi:TATA-binding protein-associated factor